MIVRGEQDVTDAVLRELARAPDPRFREIMSAAVRHLHAFVREAKLTEAEFQQACAVSRRWARRPPIAQRGRADRRVRSAFRRSSAC